MTIRTQSTTLVEIYRQTRYRDTSNATKNSYTWVATAPVCFTYADSEVNMTNGIQKRQRVASILTDDPATGALFIEKQTVVVEPDGTQYTVESINNLGNKARHWWVKCVEKMTNEPLAYVATGGVRMAGAAPNTFID